MRQAVADLASQPVRNLSGDPRATSYAGSDLCPWNDRWAANTTYSLVTGATDGPFGTGLTTFAHMVTTATGGAKAGLGFNLSGNPESLNWASPRMIRCRPGEVHRVSMYVRTSLATASVNLRLRTGVSTGNFGTADVNVVYTVSTAWIRITATITAGAGDDRIAALVTLPTVGDGVYMQVTGFMHTVDQPLPTDYRDGNTPGWRWTGTALLSASVGWPRPVTELTNLARDPRAVQVFGAAQAVWSSGRWFGGGTATGTYVSVTGATDGPAGISTYKRKTWSNGGGQHTGDSGFDTVKANLLLPASPGSVYTVGWWMRTSASGKLANLSGYTWGPDGTTAATGGSRNNNSSLFTLVPNTWHWIVRTVTVPAGRTDVAWQSVVPDISISSTSLWAPGDTLDATGLVVVAGNVPGLTYADGTWPGWQWKGTANASESYGQPYTLDSIAGPPVATCAAPAVQTIIPAGSIVPATDGRTLYSVFDIVDLTTPWAVVAAFGSAGASGFIIDVDDTTGIRTRYDAPGGSTNWWVKDSGPRTVGRHVAVASVDPGLGLERLIVDGRTEVTRAIPSSGAPVFDRVARNGNASSVGVYSVGFNGSHDTATRMRILAWLARQYGGPIPAGY